MKVTIEIPRDVLDKLEEELKEVKKPEAAVKTAVNAAAKTIQKNLSVKAASEYRYKGKKSAFMAASKINKATAKDPEAEIVFSGKVNEMQDFNLRNRKNGLAGAVLKSQRIRTLKGSTGKAFLVKFSNGHEAVATRQPPSKTIKKRGSKYTKHSVALRTWASPSIPIMAGGERVYGQLEEESRNIVLEEIEKVMAKLVNQGGNG